MGGRIRVFIALPVPETVRRKLATIRTAFEKENIPFRWVKPENIHLTLVFLGEVDCALIEAVGKAMDRVACKCSTIPLRVKGLGVFPTIKRPRVLWAGISGETARLKELKRSLDSRLQTIPGLGHIPDQRSFKAHLTLARIKRMKRQLDVRQLSSAMMQNQSGLSSSIDACMVCLIKSELTPNGAVYTELKRVELGDTFSNDEK